MGREYNIAATAALLLVIAMGCSHEEFTDETNASSPYEIDFYTSVVETRAGAVEGDLEDEANSLFNLEAWIHNTSIAEGEDTNTDADYERLMRTTVSYIDNQWVAANTLFWPMASGVAVDFFAWRGLDDAETEDLVISPNKEKITIVYNKRVTRIGENQDGSIPDEAMATILYKSTTQDNETTGRIYDEEVSSSDVMYACTLNQVNPTDQSLAGATTIVSHVQLDFKHILTLLNFRFISEIADDGSSLRADIKAMTLHNVKSGRTFTSRVTSDEGVLLEEDKWFIDFDEDGNAIETNTCPNFLCVPTLWGGEAVPKAIDETTGKPVRMGADCENDILVIPQEIKEWTPQEYSIPLNDDPQNGAFGTYLRLYCDIYHVASDGTETHTFGDGIAVGEDATEVTMPDEYCIFIPITSTGIDGNNDLWQCGHKVTYEIILGAGYNKDGNHVKDDLWEESTGVEVGVTVSVSGWNDGGESDFEF